MKHTKGPWVVKNERRPSGVVFTGIGPGESKVWVAKLAENTPRTFDEDQANAYLIASAPDLLEALEFIILNCAQGSVNYICPADRERALGAIKKAKGALK